MRPLLGIIGLIFLCLLVPLSLAQQSASSTPSMVLVTVFSAGPKVHFTTGYGHLWIDGNKIGFIERDHFLTLELSEGDHSFIGENNLGHEGSVATIISIHGDHSFVRLSPQSNGAPFAPVHRIAEKVTCEQAYGEAATMKPVSLKRVEKASLDNVVRSSFFPQCEKETVKN